VVASLVQQVFHGNFTESSLQIRKVVKTWSAFFMQNPKDAWKRWDSGPAGCQFESKAVNLSKKWRERWLFANFD
jgi:hypothetical protein